MQRPHLGHRAAVVVAARRIRALRQAAVAAVPPMAEEAAVVGARTVEVGAEAVVAPMVVAAVVERANDVDSCSPKVSQNSKRSALVRGVLLWRRLVAR